MTKPTSGSNPTYSMLACVVPTSTIQKNNGLQ